MHPSSVLPGRRATAVALVAAPLAEIIEALLSPLDGRSTALDLRGIALHPGRFEISLGFGLLGTLLYFPAFLGLAGFCVQRTPRVARTGAWLAVLSMAGFCVVRGVQLAELQAVRDHAPRAGTARIFDDISSSPLGVAVVLMFLGGAFVGTIVLAAATWRAGLPKAASVLLGLFQVVDLALPDHPDAWTALSHVVLLVALGWFAVVLWAPRETAGSPVEHRHDPEGALSRSASEPYHRSTPWGAGRLRRPDGGDIGGTT